MKYIEEYLASASRGRVVALSTVIFLLFVILVLPAEARRAELSANGADSPDTSLYYTADSLNNIAEAYGSDGRQAYIKARYSFDILWPVVYTAFLVLSVTWLEKKCHPYGKLSVKAALVPVAAMLLDFFENAATSTVMHRFPDPAPLAASLAGIFTATKWLLVSASGLLLVWGINVLLYSSIRQALASRKQG